MVEEHPEEENSLANYNLARDRETRQTRKCRRFGYKFELAFIHCSYEDLANKEPKPF